MNWVMNWVLMTFGISTLMMGFLGWKLFMVGKKSLFDKQSLVSNQFDVLKVNTTSGHVFSHSKNCPITVNLIIDPTLVAGFSRYAR